MITTLFQHYNAVLRYKSSLQIVSCNITCKSNTLLFFSVTAAEFAGQRLILTLFRVGDTILYSSKNWWTCNALGLPTNWRHFRSNWTLEMMGFEARGNLEYPEKKSWSERNPTKNSNYTYNTGSMSGLRHPGHSGGSQGISGDRLLHGRIGIRFLWDDAGLLAGNLTIE